MRRERWANDSSISIPMIYTPAKLRSDVLPRRNTIGLVIIVRARCISKSRSIGRYYFFCPSSTMNVIGRIRGGASRAHCCIISDIIVFVRGLLARCYIDISGVCERITRQIRSFDENLFMYKIWHLIYYLTDWRARC